MVYIKVRLKSRDLRQIKELGLRPGDVTRAVREHVGQQVAMQGTIDPIPADDYALHKTEEWMEYFNRIGQLMIGASHIYRAPESVLRDLRRSWRQAWLISQPKIIYNRYNFREPDDMGAKIIHNFGSTVVKPKEIYLQVPVYHGERVAKVVENGGLPFLQAFFDTNDNGSKLIRRLEEISEFGAEDIFVSTTSAGRDRTEIPKRTALFYTDCSWQTPVNVLLGDRSPDQVARARSSFFVCDYVDFYEINSYGVSINREAAGQRAGK